MEEIWKDIKGYEGLYQVIRDNPTLFMPREEKIENEFSRLD